MPELAGGESRLPGSDRCRSARRTPTTVFDAHENAVPGITRTAEFVGTRGERGFSGVNAYPLSSRPGKFVSPSTVSISNPLFPAGSSIGFIALSRIKPFHPQ